jgi:hypothetical protein
MKSNQLFSKVVNIRITLTVLIGLMIMFSSYTKANAQSTPYLNYSDIEKEWKLFESDNGIQLYIKKADRNDVKNGIFQELVLFKFVNTTNTKLEINWRTENWYDGKCWNCNKTTNEEAKKLVLDAGESVEGVTERDSNRDLQLFSKFLNYEDKPELTKFRFVNLEVKPL